MTTTHNGEKFWIQDPSVLINTKNRDALWPFAAKLTAAERYNALTRWAIIATILLVLITMNPSNMIWGGVAIAGLAIAEQSYTHPSSQRNRGGLGVAELAPTQTPYVPFVPDGSTILQKPEAFEFVPTTLKPNPPLLDGVAPDGSDEALQNPYQNPLPYDPGVAVRSKRSRYQPRDEPWIDNLYRGSGEVSMSLFANPLPDQTLMARRVFWNYDPQPDIVSSEARVADRPWTY